VPHGSEYRELHTGRRARLRRRSVARIAAVAAFAVLLLAVMVGVARRQGPGERIVTRAAAPKIVTVTVPVPILVPAPSPPVSPPARQPSPVAQQPRRVLQAADRAVPPAAEPAPETPQAGRTPSAGELAAQYRAVGQTLRTRGDSSTSDALWTRYRRIRLGDCLLADDKRAGCAQVLDAIASDARGQ
jgi:hypothetical protein